MMFFSSGVQGVWVQRGTFTSLKPIALEEWSKSDGEAQIEAMGGSVDVGESYASNFLVINPQEKLTDGDKKFSVTLKVDSSMSGTVTVYKADKNNLQWRKVDADIDDGVAKMQVDSGTYMPVLLTPSHKGFQSCSGLAYFEMYQQSSYDIKESS
jgi:hypothetical protein